METSELLPGTLDLLILKAVSLGPLHGVEVVLICATAKANGAGRTPGFAANRRIQSISYDSP